MTAANLVNVDLSVIVRCIYTENDVAIAIRTSSSKSTQLNHPLFVWSRRMK
jgi:hypothetical protein